MAKRLYSSVVKGSSSEEESERISQALPMSMVYNWLECYQKEDEHISLQKALNLSKVCYLI